MKPKAKIRQLVECVDNNGFAVSLESGKIYLSEHDAKAEKHGLVRIMGRVGESYLYPKALFSNVDLPEVTKKALGFKLKRTVRSKKAISKKSQAA